MCQFEVVSRPVPQRGLVRLKFELASCEERSSKVDASMLRDDLRWDAYANRVAWLSGILGGGTGYIANALATVGSALG